MNSKIQRKICEEAGLVFSGITSDNENEYIGTDKKWADALVKLDEFENHDCKKSPDSGCAICAKYEQDN
jgi:hypothetical protein